MLPGTAATRAQGSRGSAALSRCSARRADVPWMCSKTDRTRGGRGGDPPGQAHRWSNSCRGRPGTQPFSSESRSCTRRTISCLGSILHCCFQSAQALVTFLTTTEAVCTELFTTWPGKESSSGVALQPRGFDTQALARINAMSLISSPQSCVFLLDFSPAFAASMSSVLWEAPLLEGCGGGLCGAFQRRSEVAEKQPA
ncbi:uncharacterized protein GJ701_005861 isoform 1-T1 [Geothlypis trichas]